MQVTAVTLALIGFGIAIYMVPEQFASVHSYFGLATLLLAFLSPFLGTAAHFMWKPSRNRIPIFPDVLHWWIGRITLVLSYCTILLGMYYLRVSVALALGFVGTLITYTFVFAFLDISKIKEIGFVNYLSLRTNLRIEDTSITSYN